MSGVAWMAQKAGATTGEAGACRADSRDERGSNDPAPSGAGRRSGNVAVTVDLVRVHMNPLCEWSGSTLEFPCAWRVCGE